MEAPLREDDRKNMPCVIWFPSVNAAMAPQASYVDAGRGGIHPISSLRRSSRDQGYFAANGEGGAALDRAKSPYYHFRDFDLLR